MKRPKLGLWHRCAVAVVDVQHSHLGRAHFLDPCAVPLVIDKLGSAQVALLRRVSASKWWTRGKLGPKAVHERLKSGSVRNVASVELSFFSHFAHIDLGESNLALAVHLLLLLLLHLLDGSLRHIILPDPLLRRFRVVLRVLDLVAIVAAISSEVHACVALCHQVDREVLVLAEEVADEVASFVLTLHLYLDFPLENHLLDMERRLISELLRLDFASVGHLPAAPRARDASQQERDDASLAGNVDAEPRTRGNVLDEALHLAGPLEERQELLALLQLACHVAHPVSWSVLLVVQALPCFLSLLLCLQKLVVFAAAIIISLSVSDHCCQALADERLGNIDAADHDCAAELLWETALARLGARSLHIIYCHLHLVTNQLLPKKFPSLKHERHIIERSEVRPSLGAAVSVFGPGRPDRGQVQLAHLAPRLHHQRVPVDHLDHLASELPLLVRQGALGRFVISPHPHPLLLRKFLGLAVLLRTSSHLRYTPVDAFGHPLPEKAFCNVASGMNDRAHKSGDLVHGVVAVRLKHRLHIALEQPGLSVVMSLNGKRLTLSRIGFAFRAKFSLRRPQSRHLEGDVNHFGEQEESEGGAIPHMLHHRLDGLALMLLNQLQTLLAPRDDPRHPPDVWTEVSSD